MIAYPVAKDGAFCSDPRFAEHDFAVSEWTRESVGRVTVVYTANAFTCRRCLCQVNRIGNVEFVGGAGVRVQLPQGNAVPA